MRTVAVVLSALAAAASAMTLNHERLFGDWKSQYGVSYKTAEEEALRMEIFKMNARRIVEHNSKGLGWTMALNQFADLSSDEFAARYIGGYLAVPRRQNPVALEHLRVSPADLPASVDWEAAGAVTPIKNQGQCGSCWAFSTTGSVEGINEIKTGKLVSLSEQQLVDCSGSYGNQGCNGGLMDYAFQYIIANGGLCTEASYPYTGQDGTCQSSSCTSAATISGYTDVPQNSENALMSAVAQQPVSVAIEADQSAFQLYKSGVFTSTCGTNLDHGVLAVGYGNLNGQDYYKVKNSWGSGWGEKGYFRIKRDMTKTSDAGVCGLQLQPSYPSF